MNASTDLIVLIPAFNEGGRIAKTIVELREVVPNADILVVDDGSFDVVSGGRRDSL
jgi:glycosyltransferase involved in cell wall biosynthesis